MQKMNEQDMESMLKNMAKENERYIAKVWAVIMSMNNSRESALNNKYCYLGITENAMNFVVINSFNVKSIECQISVPINTMTKVSIKKGIIPQRRIIKLETLECKMKISMMLNSFGGDFSNQKEHAELLIEKLSNITI